MSECRMVFRNAGTIANTCTKKMLFYGEKGYCRALAFLEHFFQYIRALQSYRTKFLSILSSQALDTFAVTYNSIKMIEKYIEIKLFIEIIFPPEHAPNQTNSSVLAFSFKISISTKRQLFACNF
jgi:hypothetical protein